MDYKDYYQILGVDRKAGEQEIKRAYRKLAMKYHPDHNPNNPAAEDRFKDINEAFQVLGDASHRRRYDDIADSYTGWMRDKGTHRGYNWEAWATDRTRQTQGETRQTQQESYPGGFSFDDFSEFFRRVFAGIAGYSKEHPTQGKKNSPAEKPFEYQVVVSVAEAYCGALRKLDVDGKRLEVKIPAGVRSGTRVRIPGGILTPDHKKKDLFLLIRVENDPYYQRKGNDLHVNLRLDLVTAVLGGEVTVRTPGGNVALSIPPGTQPGKVFRLADKGMPQLKNPAVHGSQYVHVDVHIPEKLTAEQRELYQKLASLNSRRK
jgi:curved DNA-binding protein